MTQLNAVLGKIFDVLLLPFRGLPLLVPIVLFSVALAVVMLLVYKKTSDQAKIARTKARIQAGLFEIRLFSDDPRAIVRAQTDILRHNIGYFGLSLVPLAWMIVPLVLVFLQLQAQFGYAGFDAGDVTIVRAQLAEDWRADLAGVPEGGRPPISLETDGAVEVLTPAVWLPSRNEVLWKVAIRERGDHAVFVKLGDSSYEKSLRVQPGIVRRSPVRHAGAFLDQLLYPAEAPLPKGPLTGIGLDYPETWRGTTFGGPNWMWAVLIFSVIFGFALKGKLRVTI